MRYIFVKFPNSHSIRFEKQVGFCWGYAQIFKTWFDSFDFYSLDEINKHLNNDKKVLFIGVPDYCDKVDYFIDDSFYKTKEYEHLKEICEKDRDLYIVFCSFKDGSSTYYGDGNSYLNKLYEVVDKLGVKFDNTMVITKFADPEFEFNKVAKELNRIPFKNVSWNWSYLVDWDIEETTKKEKHFICLNRIRKPHRLYIGYLLWKNSLIDNNVFSYWSYYGDEMELVEKNFFPDGKEYEVKMLAYEFGIRDRESSRKFLSNIPYKADKIDNIVDKDYSYIVTEEMKELYKKSFLNIITEDKWYSNSIDEKVSVTEKVFKAIKSKQPFLVVGQPNTLRHLKRLGFKTFDKWFDESYDSIDKLKTRTDLVFSEVKRICSYDMEKINSIYNEMEEILEYNYSLIKLLSSKEYFLDNINLTLGIKE